MNKPLNFMFLTLRSQNMLVILDANAM